MGDFGLFVGFGSAVRGREQKAAQVFNEAVEYFTKLQNEGSIASWQPVFLEPHGGDLGGFFLVWGERDKIAQIRSSDDLTRLNARAQLIVENYGVVGAETGDRVGEQMGIFLQNSGELA
jgi:hypothetical protein